MGFAPNFDKKAPEYEIFALQFAKAAGARVIRTSSSPAKLERLRECS